MLNNLDDLKKVQVLDTGNMLRSIQEFPIQAERCWADWKKIALPTSYIQTKNVLLCGMGGSGIGNAIATDLARSSEKHILTWSDYDIPGYVNNDTLVIVTSYSGNTEESISALKKASQKTNKIITISSGGKIASLSTNFRTPHYQIDYGSEPRAAIGYLLTSLLAIFDKLDIFKIKDEDFREAILILKGLQKKIDMNVTTGSNNAKILAQQIYGKIPIVYGSGNLSSVARRWKGGFNENAKIASYFEIIPELNHNSLVGLEMPKDLRSKIYVLILQSNFDHPRIKLRQSITGQILDKNRIGHDFVLIEPSPTPLSEILQMIQFGDYVSYYLAILNNVDPSSVPIIKYLKDKLAEKPLD